VLNEILGLHNKHKAAVHLVHKLTGPKKKKKKKSKFLANAHRCPEENWLVESSQAVPDCPDISTIKMKISMEK